MKGLGAKVFSAPQDSVQQLMEQFGITAEQAGDGSPDIPWLRDEQKAGPPGGH